MVFVILGEIMLVSLNLSFETFLEKKLFDIIQIPFLAILSLDIFLSFFKGFQDKGVYQIESQSCFNNYLKGYFFLDFFCMLSYILGYYLDSKLIFCIFLFRLITKYYRYQLNVTENFQLNERFGNEIVKLMELVFTIFLLAHIFSCVWYWIGYRSFLEKNFKNQTETEKKTYISWIEAYDLDNGTWQEKYVASLFWVFTVMTTIGFGDIVPQNQDERLMAICIMILSCFIFAYSVNSIGVLLNAINEKESMHRLRLKSLNSYMNTKKISDSLQSKIRCYLDYLYQEEKNGTSQNESLSLEFLNKNLKDELLIEANFHVLIKMKIFNLTNKSFSQQFLADLAIHVEEKIYFPDDVIFHQGQIDPQMYFVEKGQVKIIVKKSGKDKDPTVLQQLKVGQSFGQFNFFSSQETLYSTIAVNVTTIKYIKYSDFIKVLQSYPDDFENFCMLKEYLLLNQNFDMLNITCSLCTWGNHQEINCSLINYKPQRNLVLCKFDHSTQMPRNKNFKRKQFVKPNSYKQNIIVQEQAKEFQEDKGIIVYENKNEYDQTPSNNQLSKQNNLTFKDCIYYTSNSNRYDSIDSEQCKVNQLLQIQSIDCNSIQKFPTPIKIFQQDLYNSSKSNQEIQQIQLMNRENMNFSKTRGNIIQNNKRVSITIGSNNIEKYPNICQNCNNFFKIGITNENNDNEKFKESHNYPYQNQINQENQMVGTNTQQIFNTNLIKEQQNLQKIKRGDYIQRHRIDSKQYKNQQKQQIYGSYKNGQEDYDKQMLNQSKFRFQQDQYNYQDDFQGQLQNQLSLNYQSNKGINLMQQGMNMIQYGIRGDAIEIDKLQLFSTYRHKNNYIFLIEQYNLQQESHRQKLLTTSERKTKRRYNQKSNILNLRQIIESQFS